MPFFTSHFPTRWIVSTVLVGCFFLSSCLPTSTAKRVELIMQDHPDILASFQVELNTFLPEGTQLALEWIDPLSDFNLSPEIVPMTEVDNRHFNLDVPVKKGQILQYRYVANGENKIEELSSDGYPLPSRFFYITDHSQIKDTVLGFSTSDINSPTGIVEGIVSNKSTGLAAQGLIVSSAGLSATTNADGKFRLVGIPTGIQNITIFSPDGSVEPLQQQAVVDENIITPVNVGLFNREMVNVTFLVRVPGNTPPSAPIRIIGNLSQLGNSYASLFGGSNIVSSMAPVLTRQANNTFMGVIQIPSGSELRYLYSLGDTFWNRELDEKDGRFYRKVFIGNDDQEIENSIASWDLSNFGPVNFWFIPPESTLPTDVVQIQFNVYGWMEPIDMWPQIDGSYKYTLFNPLNFSSPVDYRFCRSHMCGLQEKETNAIIASSFESGNPDIHSIASEHNWAGWQPVEEPTVVTTEETDAKHPGFNSVVEITDTFRPEWMSYLPSALDSITGLNANTLIIPVTQTFRTGNPVWLNTDPGRDPSIKDIQKMVSLAKERNLSVYLMASLRHKTISQDSWPQMSSNPVGWKEWFDSIQDFYHSVAILANSVNADGLILGDEDVSSILANSHIPNGLENSYPNDASVIWNDILRSTKSTFGKKTLLAIHYDDFQSLDKDLLDPVDGIYLLSLGRVSDSTGDIQTYSEGIARKLDDVLAPNLLETGKLVWIGLDFPSIESAYTGCVELSGQCRVSSVLNFPAPAQPELVPSLNQQATLYNASLPEENRRAWITGVVTRRYSIQGNYQDQSSSIRGKPAADVVWYWFSTMMGIPTQ